MVAVGVEQVEGFGEQGAVAGEPRVEGGGVGFVEIAPEDQAFAAFGVGACDGEQPSIRRRDRTSRPIR